jgi:hypothetical protein
MSIASYSVVGRILAQVQQGAPLARLSSVERLAAPDQVFELRRTRHVHEPPFATSFHFWAYALRAFLEGQARPDLFEAMATHGLCERVGGETAVEAFADLVGRMSTRDVGLDVEGLQAGYRMIDQDVVVSWVAESKGEQWAVFWARPAWLARAVPVDPDESPAD